MGILGYDGLQNLVFASQTPSEEGLEMGTTGKVKKAETTELLVIFRRKTSTSYREKQRTKGGGEES